MTCCIAEEVIEAAEQKTEAAYFGYISLEAGHVFFVSKVYHMRGRRLRRPRIRGQWSKYNLPKVPNASVVNSGR
jgi:hypothetical protein